MMHDQTIRSRASSKHFPTRCGGIGSKNFPVASTLLSVSVVSAAHVWRIIKCCSSILESWNASWLRVNHLLLLLMLLLLVLCGHRSRNPLWTLILSIAVGQRLQFGLIERQAIVKRQRTRRRNGGRRSDTNTNPNPNRNPNRL